jgi:hypothetical protein
MARQLPPAFSFELRLAVDLPLWIAFRDDKATISPTGMTAVQETGNLFCLSTGRSVLLTHAWVLRRALG